MRHILLFLALMFVAYIGDLSKAFAQSSPDFNAFLAPHLPKILKPSRQTISPVIDEIVAQQSPEAKVMLQAWEERRLGHHKAQDQLYIIEPHENGWTLKDFSSQYHDVAMKNEVAELKPNAGVRELLASALVEFTLVDPDPKVRAAAVEAIARAPNASHLEPLRETLADETEPSLAARKARLERILTLRFDPDSAARIRAIHSFQGDISLEARAALNPLLATTRHVGRDLPKVGNIAAQLRIGHDIERIEAYELLVNAGLAPSALTLEAQRQALSAHIYNDAVAGVALASLSMQRNRDIAYDKLEKQGLVPPAATLEEQERVLNSYKFFDLYNEPDASVTDAVQEVLSGIETKVGWMTGIDLGLDAMSLASIYFLAAVGLAITFGVMGVINMAHGEFIMMGAYTGYVVQQYVPDRSLSILLALPLAFFVTFAAGVLMERLVIRHLYRRPLETLLATFGIAIALQQLAKNIFGTQARPLTAPVWLEGQIAFNDVIAISIIRVVIFVMAIAFLCFFLWLMKRTRVGLELRAVTQNPQMAASMGIVPDRINMLAFGLGSGIAGIAGVAIGLFAKVTSELGSDYIVQSFMTVVVGGVGNIWGTLAGALMIGSAQKLIEWLNPGNTLAALTYMILFVILFIQFRPRGLIALRGRAAGD